MWIVVGLFNQGELLSLGLIEARFDGVSLLESLEAKHEQFRVVLVVQWREGYMLEFA